MENNDITPFLKEKKVVQPKEKMNTAPLKRSKKYLKTLRDSVDIEYFEQLRQTEELKNINISSTRLSVIAIAISLLALITAIISLYWQIKGS